MGLKPELYFIFTQSHGVTKEELLGPFGRNALASLLL